MRVIKHGRNHPYVVKLGEVPGMKEKLPPELAKEEVYICACGLSRHKPFCDGSHRLVQDEEQGKIFVYSADGQRAELAKDTAIEQINSAPNEYE